MGAPIWVLSAYLASRFHTSKLLRGSDEEVTFFNNALAQLETSHLWFKKNIPLWLAILDKWESSHYSQKTLQGLEVGSWEGVSSYFILSKLTQIHLTCVDTWQGADEHQIMISNNNPADKIEKRFDANLKQFSNLLRLKKVKSTSQNYFQSMSRSEACFDLIYIDGSHHAKDVVQDVFCAWRLLKPGGLLIMDDYLWRYYTDPTHNPASAIIYFLRFAARYCQILFIWEQVFVLKSPRAGLDSTSL